jgi:ABC-type transporter Mla subunit MlaD
MDMTFKFRFVNEITGLFVLLAAALLAVGIFMAGNAQGLFEEKITLQVLFTTAEGSFGLKKGSEIKILNTTAGTVGQVEPTPDGAIQATFVLKERYHGFIRTNSVAVVKKTWVVTGDAYVEIKVGNRQYPMIPDGGSIECVKDTDMIDQASRMMEDLRAKALPALDKLQLILNEVPGLTAQARQTLRQGEVLMRDDLPGLTAQAQDTLRETQILLRGLERHWLLRKYVEQPLEGGPMIDPAQTGPLLEKAP